MNARAQLGRMDNTAAVWIPMILVAVGFFNYPGERTALAYTVLALVEAGLLAALWAIGGLPFLDSALRESIARKVARSLDSEVTSEEHRIWGGDTAMSYSVPWQHGGRIVMLTLDVSGTIAALQVPDGHGAPVDLNTFDSGELIVKEGEGKARGESFLDERARANLARIERIGGRRALSVSVHPNAVIVYKHTHFRAKKTLLFLNLCRPVFDRALAVCFGLPVDPPAKVCANCGGECCPTCDSRHRPGCGCE